MLEESFSSCKTSLFLVWIEWIDVQHTLLDKKISKKIAIFLGKIYFWFIPIDIWNLSECVAVIGTAFVKSSVIYSLRVFY